MTTSSAISLAVAMTHNFGTFEVFVCLCSFVTLHWHIQQHWSGAGVRKVLDIFCTVIVVAQRVFNVKFKNKMDTF